jgi:RNAse (barnase) inhibitor barstar
MIKKSNAFSYYNSSSQISRAGDDTYLGVLPLNILDATQLLEAFFDVFRFPGYFGFNWNALFDCLGDFHWLKEKTIVVVHQEMPRLADNDLTIYLDVLYEGVIDWQDTEEHRLIVYFPENCRERIIGIMD